MSKQDEKQKQEQELLKQTCEQSEDVELIQELLALQKTKTLMIKKRGLQADIENRLEQFILDNKNK
jgi:DNA sulfur modification protein DndC